MSEHPKVNMGKNMGEKQARKEAREAGVIGEADELTAELPVEEAVDPEPLPVEEAVDPDPE